MRVKPSLIERDVIDGGDDYITQDGGDGGYITEEKSIITRDVNPGL